jgi:hypothetical protein
METITSQNILIYNCYHYQRIYVLTKLPLQPRTKI